MMPIKANVARFLLGGAMVWCCARVQAQPEEMEETEVDIPAPVSAHALDVEAYSRIAREYQMRAPLWRILQAVAGDRVSAPEMSSRARLAGLLPRLKIGGRMRQGSDFLQVQSTDSGKLNLAGDEQLSVGLELQFSLDRLLFSHLEPALLRAAREQRDRRQQQRVEIIATYHRWLALVVERDLRRVVNLNHHIAINEEGARLNLFTRGAFFRMMRGTRAVSEHERNP